MRVEGIEEDTYRGGLGQQAKFVKFQLEQGSEVRGAIYIFLVYVVWLLVLLCYKTLKDVKV